MIKEITGYSLSRSFWNYAFAHPEKIKPTHISIYFFAIEHCNRLGWKNKFGFPTSMVLEAVGIKSYSVYKKCFDDLAEFGFFEVIEYSKNQYSSNIIAFKENNKANNKALDKAFIKHATKQSESTGESIDSIDKQLTNNKEPLTINLEKELLNSFDLIEFVRRKTSLKQDEVNLELKNFIEGEKAIGNFEGRKIEEIRKHFKNLMLKKSENFIKTPIIIDPYAKAQKI